MNPLGLFVTICSLHIILAIPESFDAVDPEDTYAKKIAAEYPGFLFKRAPSGFFGMRGKKQNNEGIKRAPYGFTGMRGKKAETFEEGYHYPTNEADFYELLMKWQNQLNSISYANQPYDTESNTIGKRAPSGFMGMRGKKTYD